MYWPTGTVMYYTAIFYLGPPYLLKDVIFRGNRLPSNSWIYWLSPCLSNFFVAMTNFIRFMQGGWKKRHLLQQACAHPLPPPPLPLRTPDPAIA